MIRFRKIHQVKMSGVLIAPILIPLCLSLISCATQPVRRNLPTSYQVAQGDPLPIDGLWRAKNNAQMRIERGRMYIVQNPQATLSPGMVTMRDIVQVGKNKYKGMDHIFRGTQQSITPAEIEVISKTHLVVRVFANPSFNYRGSENILQVISLDNEELFLSQFTEQKDATSVQQPTKGPPPYSKGRPAATQVDLRRIALVIGNSDYVSARLKNPVNDATDMSSTLRRLGFNVVLKTNASQQQMEQAIEDFGNRLKGGGVGLFYFAGHGLQVSGVNYLVPIGSRLAKESDIKYKAVDVGKVLDEMANAKNGLNIVILDSCRDNPFTRSFRSATRGLAIISSAPKGTLISYSTGPGQIARDGHGRNSPYTEALLRHMVEADLPIEQVFKKVRNQLGKQTNDEQTPWELSSLEGDFYFKLSGSSQGAIPDATFTTSSQEEYTAPVQITPKRKKK